MASRNSAPSQAELMQIGEVAKRVGLSLRTVRYYEEVGLVEPSARTQGGFRLYSAANVARLAILKAMKPFGLSLEEIRELMELLDAIDAPGAREGDPAALGAGLDRYRQRADERIAKLEGHLAEVRRLRAGIVRRLALLRPPAS